MIRPIVTSVFALMCTSSDPLQTKSDTQVDLVNDDENDENHVDETENLFTAATEV